MYTLFQWLLFFYLYCFFGWCFETTYVSICKKQFVNRGFMRGPFLPIYGTGATMMIAVTMPMENHVFLVFIVGMIATTILEYITGVCMEALFQVRYWDYSRKKLNFQGHICLSSSLCWGVLSVLLTFVIHPPIERFILSIPTTIANGLTIVLTIGIVADFTLSFKEALDFKDMLHKMTLRNSEIKLMLEKLDELQEKVQEIPEKVSKSFHSSSYIDRLEHLNNTMEELKNHPLVDEWKQEFVELKIKLSILKEKKSELEHQLENGKNRILKNHPTFTSIKFKEEIGEMKQLIKQTLSKSKKNTRKKK